MCASYLLVLATARALPLAALRGAIVLAHLILLLGPAADLPGRLRLSRVRAHGRPARPRPVHARRRRSAAPMPSSASSAGRSSTPPTGRCSRSPATRPRRSGVAGGLWAFKALAVASQPRRDRADRARGARASGIPPALAAAFVGLNPVLLVLAVGGAHNDTLLLLSLAAALLLTRRRRARASARRRARARRRRRREGHRRAACCRSSCSPRSARASAAAVAASAALGLLAVAAIGVLGFGVHALGFLDAVGEQQQLVATHSVPAETARLLGLQRHARGWWRQLCVAGFVVVLALRAVAHRARRRLAGRGRLDDARAAAVDRLAAAVVCDLAAAASGRQRRSAPVRRHAPVLRLRGPDPPAARRPAAQPRRATRGRRRPCTSRSPALGHRLELAGLEVLRHVQLDLRW